MSTIGTQPSPAPGRACGSCSLCCKLVGIAELKKPMGQWCPHCLKHGGCGIYDSRPEECRTFNCGWLMNAEVGDEWLPTRAKMVLYYLRDGGADKLVVHVDSGSPLAWRNEPYYSQLKRWSQSLLEHNGLVNIYVRNQVFVVLPNKDVDLGTFKPGDKISLRRKQTAVGLEYDVYKTPTTNVPPE